MNGSQALWKVATAALLAAAALGCRAMEPQNVVKTLEPSNFRDWAPDQAVLPTADVHGDLVKVHNVRNCYYLSADDYLVRHDDRVYDLNLLESVDFIVAPFKETPAIAHAMLSFGFRDGDRLGVSVEIRKERDEEYGPLNGLFNQYEIMYVLGDERDLLNLLTVQRDDDVYIYRTKATPEQARALFLDVTKRVNKLAVEPEFYHTITNNCTTNIVRHVNRLSPNAVPYTLEILLPGHSPRLAYDLGLLDTTLPFETVKRRAKVNNQIARRNADAPDFSEVIRR